MKCDLNIRRHGRVHDIYDAPDTVLHFWKPETIFSSLIIGGRRVPRSRDYYVKAFCRAAFVAIPALWPSISVAQVGEELLTRPAVPSGFDRGRNIAVTERARTDYDPLGIDVRSFRVISALELGIGGTNNTYSEANNPRAALFSYASPSVTAASLWSRHFLQFQAAGRFVRYIDQSPRNENTWNLGLSSRIDLGSSLKIEGRLLRARSVEGFFSGDVEADIAALSRIDTYYGIVRGTYSLGRTRVILSADHSDDRYGSIRFQDGAERDQSGRDRGVSRLTAQLDYARTPSVSLFAQARIARNDFVRPLAPAAPERDSTGYRGLIGVNFDLAGRARGSIGAGYIIRDFDSPIYNGVKGLSVEARIELFPDDLSTYTIDVSRSIGDSSFGNGAPYFDSRFTLRLDREIRRNLIGNVSASYSVIEYQDLPSLGAEGYQFALGARYLSTRRVRLDFAARYSDRSTRSGTVGYRVGELRGQFGIVLQR
ncbi:outer membrane beta-barrel protein [Sphingomonas arantia]|uniref:Outer membrane beta-barrel protein n=1 Tax=Sphingomonas arantia TaxID=1460676 RepID=A0ABW4TSE6_9SPHN